MKKKLNSAFLISLDFELFWGVFDSRGNEYYPNIEEVHRVVPRLLALFEKYNVGCTWATVGALFAKNKKEYMEYAPFLRPSYVDRKYSSYEFIEREDNIIDKIFFSPDLIDLILDTPRQELASHSYSHYYALEPGQKPEEFRQDLEACISIAKNYGANLKSFVFPRNQFDTEYLSICKDLGFSSYRGNPSHWAYKAASRKNESAIKRAFRLIDTYVPLSGSLAYEFSCDRDDGILNIPASLFLRPYSRKLKLFEKFKMSRIKYSMRHAAKSNKIFHLWWHPHNFSSNQEENFYQLEQILKYFKYLESEYGMKSMTMNEAYLEVRGLDV
ncbi:hypothetical protein BC354_12820 [Vibrio cholerae]|nr:polysaccharide deacetylase family protein [Vibrio cholerae]EKF9149876.1 polysaccharide deacetylase family protein [Vibrio cholerae]RGP87344.1 hypothetical protein BC354_12820 [Vibrio cholerae]RGP94632.1 hypothetical protein BC352_12475 [Vibrio cholerae]